jgi:hypothetical protein
MNRNCLVDGFIGFMMGFLVACLMVSVVEAYYPKMCEVNIGTHNGKETHITYGVFRR